MTPVRYQGAAMLNIQIAACVSTHPPTALFSPSTCPSIEPADNNKLSLRAVKICAHRATMSKHIAMGEHSNG
jgi:ABC-type uncharacterized transport system auxiliary subunit